MELNVASKVSGEYSGNLIYSKSSLVSRVEVAVQRLNDILVKVSFILKGQEYFFRAMISEQNEGHLMIIQDRVTDEYILSGVSGFLNNKPNIHGGLLSTLDSFYFHIAVKDFAGETSEFYFMGKERFAFNRLQNRRSADFFKASVA